MTEKHKRYFDRIIAEIVCDKTNRCAECDAIFNSEEKDECPKCLITDVKEYNAFVLSFAERLREAVLQEKKLYFQDLEVDTTEILDLLKCIYNTVR